MKSSIQLVYEEIDKESRYALILDSDRVHARLGTIPPEELFQYIDAYITLGFDVHIYPPEHV